MKFKICINCLHRDATVGINSVYPYLCLLCYEDLIVYEGKVNEKLNCKISDKVFGERTGSLYH